MTDARFEEGTEQPLKLAARSRGDVEVLGSLLQDAVLTTDDIKWLPNNRRFAMLVNRFRWEDGDAAEREGRAFERVRSVMSIEDVEAVRASGINPADKEQVLSLLTLEFVERAEDDCAGTLRLVFSGDGALELDIECIEITLDDVTRPYIANSGHRPDHGV